MRLKFIFSILIIVFCVSKSWSQLYDELNEKAIQFQMTNVDSSIHYFQLAEKIAIIENDSSKMVHVYSALGNLFRIQQKLEKAKQYNQLALDVSRTDLEKTVNLLQLGMVYEYLDLNICDSLFRKAERLALNVDDNNLHSSLTSNYASVKYSMGDFYGAIDYFLKAEKLAISDLPRATINEKIASIFLRINNLDRANEYIQKAIELTERNNYKIRNHSVALVYARILQKENKITAAKKEIVRAIEYLKNTSKSHSLASAYNLMTDLQITESDYQSALISNKKSMEFFDNASAQSKSQSLTNQCKLFIFQKNYNNAITSAEKVIQIAKEKNLPTQLKNAHFFASQAFEKNNRKDLAFDHHKRYTSLKDSLFQSEQISLVNSLESKFNRTESANKIALLDSKNQIQEVRLSQQKTILTIGGIALALIGGLLFFLFQSNKKVKSQNQVISKSLDEKDTLLREIHHRVKNNLQLVSSLLSLQSLSVNDPKALEALNSGKSRVKSMALIHQDLYNRENLTGINVKDYLEKLCRELFATYQIHSDQISLKTEIENIDLDVDTLVPIGLIINELITNSLKYAFPKNKKGEIVIKLLQRNDKLILEIKDDGIGFDISKKSKTSFGFKLVNTLLRQLRGEIQQVEYEGTHLILSIDEYKLAA